MQKKLTAILFSIFMAFSSTVSPMAEENVPEETQETDATQQPEQTAPQTVVPIVGPVVQENVSEGGTIEEPSGDPEEDGTPAEDEAPEAQTPVAEEVPEEQTTAVPGAYRVIVATNNDSIFHEENVLSSFNHVFLLGYETLEAANEAVAYYSTVADFAALDTAVFVTDGEEVTPEEEVVSETEMTAEANPLVELETAVAELPSEEETPVEETTVEPANEEKAPYTIAVIDTGVTYEDIQAVSMLGEDTYDYNGHGTRMVDYIREEDPDAKIISIKALGDDGKGDISAVYAAVMYAIEAHVDVINMSFNAFSTEENAVLKDAVTKAEEAGIIVVASAGNNNLDAKYFTPSNISDAIVIGSAVQTEEKVTKQEFSNFGESVDYYVLSDSTSEGAARYSGILSEVGQEEIDNAINTGKVFLLDENFEVTGGNVSDADQSGEFSQNDVTITFMSGADGKFEDGSTQNVVTYREAPAGTKYSHTSNVDDTGLKSNDYGNLWTNANITGTDRGDTSQAHVVTIPGADSLTVELYYNGEGVSYDWVSVWQGSHPTYTAASNATSTGYVTTAMGAPDDNNKFGGAQSGSYTVNGNSLTNMGHTTLTIPGDTVTFGFKSDRYSCGKGYGYYAIVTGNPSIVSGTYKEPIANNDDYKFGSWNSSADGTGTTIDINSVTTSQTVYAKYENTIISSGTHGCPWKLKNTGELIIGTDGGNCTLTSTMYYASWPWYNNRSSVKKATLKGTVNAGAGLYGMFYEMSNMTEIEGLANFNTSAATNMYYMFQYCYGLTSLDLSNFNTSAVTNMSYMFNGCSKLTNLDVSSFNTSSVTNMDYMFAGCSKLTSLDVSNFNTSKVTNMSYMFANCSGLTSLDVSKFNTSAVRDMRNMFSGCSSLTSLDFSNFNTSAVTDMISMFENCSKLTSLDLSNFNTSAVTNMSHMFYYCFGLTSLNLSGFNTFAVTSMNNMFGYCSKLTSLDVSNFNTSAVTDMGYMFSDCSSLTSLDVSSFNTDAATNMSRMFDYCSNLTSLNLSNFNTSAVTNMSYMFNGCYKLKSINLGANFSFKGKNITSTSSQALLPTPPSLPFTGKWELTGNLDESKQYTSEEMRDNDPQSTAPGWYVWTKDLRVDAPVFDKGENVNTAFKKLSGQTSASYYTSNTSITSIQRSAAAPGSNVETADISSEKNGSIVAWYDNGIIYWYSASQKVYLNKNDSSMFRDFQNTTQIDLSGVNTVFSTDMSYMFNGCYKLTNLDLSNFDTSAVTSMYYMFYNCYKLTSLDLSKFNTSAVTNMSYMFSSCYSLTSIDVSHFNTSSVTNMSYMFYGCSNNLTSLDLSNFNTSSVTSMGSMFQSCYNLTSLDLSSFNTSSVTNMSYMFQNCSSLTGLDLSSFNMSAVTNMGSMFNSCSSLTSLDLSNFNTSSATNMSYMFNGCSKLKSINLGANFSFKGKNITSTSSQALLPTPSSSLPFTGKWELTGNLDESKQYTSEEMRDNDPQSTAPGWYVWTTNKAIFASGQTVNVSFKTLAGDSSPTYSSSNTTITSIQRSQTAPASGVTTSDVSKDQDGSIVAWFDSGTIYWWCASTYAVYLNEDASSMFQKMVRATQIDVSSVNTSLTTNMGLMFADCSWLTNLDVSSFNTSAVTDMHSMFWNCYSLASLDLSNFNTSAVSVMSSMFYECSGLTSLDVSSFNTSARTDSQNMFGWCSNLKSLNLGTNFSFNGRYTQVYLPTPSSYFPYIGKWELTGNLDESKQYTSAEMRNNDPQSTAPGWYVWAKDLRVDAPVFAGGTSVNAAFKKLSGQTSAMYDTVNTTITSIQRSTEAPESNVETADVSTEKNGSIVAWYDNGIIYWYSASQKVYLYNDASHMFRGFQNTTQIDLSGVNTVFTTSMYFMFTDCSKLTSLDVSSFNTSAVTNMGYMFNGCSSLTNLDVSSFNTSAVTDMSYMFDGCYSLASLDLSKLNTSAVTNMSYMFDGCSKLKSINLGANFSFKGKNITSTSSQALLPTPSSSLPFTGKWELTGNLDESKQYTSEEMRDNDPQSTAPGWYVWTKDLRVDAPVFDKGENVNTAFKKLSGQTSASYNTSITSIQRSAAAPGSNVETADISSEKNGSIVAWYDNGIIYWYSASQKVYLHSDASHMFRYFQNTTQIDLSGVNTVFTTDMSYMFYNCYSLANVDLLSFNTSSVTNMGSMFYSCYKLTSLDLSNFNTSAVTDMSYMFDDCSGLTSLDVSSFNTSAVTNMHYMFDCYRLKNINLGSNFSFRGNNIASTSNQALLPTPSSSTPYVGKWELKTNTNASKQYTPAQMRDTDPQKTAPGEYVWAINHTYTITYDANGGSVTPASSTVNVGDTLILPTPTRTGYTCTGWWTETTGGTRRAIAGGSYVPAQSETLHAQWEINNYDVKITNTVTGNTGSKAKEFSYSITYGTTTETFTLQSGDTKTFSIPYTTDYAITQTDYSAEGYTTTISGNASGKVPVDGVTVTFTNNNGVAVPSGINTNVFAGIAVVLIAIAGIVGIFLRKRFAEQNN